MPISPEHIAGNLALLPSSKYSDMVLESKTEKYRLHRSLVCTRSIVIKRNLQRDSAEAQGDIVSLADDNHDPAAVTQLVTYLYQDDYDDLEELPPSMDIRAINSARREELAVRVKEELPEWTDSRYSLSSIEGLIEPKTANTRCSLPDSVRRMKANLSVFVLAEFLNIKDPKDQAQEKFLGRARYWFPTPHDEVPAMIKAIYGATSAKDEEIRGPILRKLAEDYCENQGLLAHERCVQALKEHGDFAVGLMEAVRKHLQWHFTPSENENTALKQKISGFEQKDERREREVKLMTRNLQDAHKQLSQMVESRLRDGQKGGTTIGDAEKGWLKEDINVFRRAIEPYTELEGWADDDPLGFLPWNDRYLDFSDVSMKLVEWQ